MTTTVTARLVCVAFSVNAPPGSDVYVTGTFNHWNGSSQKMTDISGEGDYHVSLMLLPGTYEYKFVINGQYQSDPNCPTWEINEFGTLNSVISVEHCPCS